MLRIMIAFILGGTFAWMTFSRPEEAEDPEGKGPRYRPYLNGWLITPPKWVISLPQGLVERLAAVWLAGALVVLGWKIFSHLRFRRWLLRGGGGGV